MPVKVGRILEGTVSGITNFGAFIDLPNGERGMVHISEVADAYVKDINDYLKENDKVKVKVLAIDDKGRISLSIRKAETQSQISFEEQLAQFLKDSEERLSDLRNRDNKRGRGAWRGR
ncbi:MAG: S1 RNA-binding domain-containing protein [Clostridiales bacterium]|jgi:S1 RNA binding domain protein|nr:S1 RNA-binding domain-containing protein [Clostridiales bacterium]